MSKSEHSRSDSERTTKIPKTIGAKNITMALEYFAPEANTVAVAGDFNGWDIQAHMLKKSKAGWWKTNLKLAPGRYRYRFIVNGEQWSEDPENPNKEANEFDSYNSILEVR
jgi:1,4-alpha-glucan branching enzyme